MRGIVFAVIVLFSPAVQAQTCPTIANPAANSTTSFPFNAALATAAIDTARTAESATLPTLESQLPENYATLSVDQQVVVLINAERTARGIPPLNTAIQGQNDPYIANIMANHSFLIALHPDWWGLGIVHNNAVDGTLASRETSAAVPGLIAAGLGEIIADDQSPEGAVFAWMYKDADAAWGHRANILNCSWKYMGAGVAQAKANAAVFGAHSLVATVDFVNPSPTSTYVQAIPAAAVQTAVCPAAPAPSQYVCPRVSQPMIFVNLPSGNWAQLSADNQSIEISMTVSVDPLYGTPNKVLGFFVFSPATWGSPSGTVPSLGTPPQGSGAFSCPLVDVLQSALDKNSPAATDDNAVSSNCVATIPYHGNPVAVAILDTFNNLVLIEGSL